MHWILNAILLALFYLMGALLGFGLTDPQTWVSIMWLPTGFAVGGLHRGGRRMWVGVAIGATLSSMISFNAMDALVPLVVAGQTLGPLLTLLLLRWWSFDVGLGNRRDVLVFAAAAAVGMLVPATVGVSCLLLGDVITPGQLLVQWFGWYLGDLLGVFVAAPVVMGATRTNFDSVVQHGREFLGWLAVLGAICVGFMLVDDDWIGRGLPVAFTSVPLVLWASLRFGRFGSALAPLTIALAAAFATASQQGPFVSNGGHIDLMLLWAFVAMLCAVDQVTNALQAERQKAEAALAQSQMILQSIWKAQSEFIEGEAVRGIFDRILDSVLQITGSEYGFIGRFERDPLTQQPYLATLSITNIAWNEETAELYAQAGPEGMEFRNLDTLFGITVRTGETVIANDVANDPRATGRPMGHPRMTRYLGVAFFEQGEAIGMIGIANAPVPYAQVHVDILEPVLATCAGLLDAWRIRHQRDDATRRISELAFYDALTGLPNRRLLTQRLEALCQSAHPDYCACVFLDLDDFKIINDTYGHELGDRLLREIGARLTTLFVDQSTVARLAGDEFVSLTPLESITLGTANAEAFEVGLSCLNAIRAPFELDGVPVTVAASVGVYVFRPADASPTTLLRNADAAMYAAKDAGRNTVRLFDSAVQRSVERASRLQIDLRQAIDRGDLHFIMQPIIDRHDNYSSMELLARWEHPELGPVSPEEFIPLAERSGAIHPLGELAFERACDWIAGCSHAHQPLRFSINVSAVQLTRHDFVQRVISCMSTRGVKPSSLTLEITESQILLPDSDATRMLGELRDLGLAVVIDDFGTGYASFSYLKELPLSGVKLARTFTIDVDSNPSTRQLVESMIQLAHSLGLEVTAEGVETTSQHRALLEIGCDHFQGYLWGRPERAHHFGEHFPCLADPESCSR